ncbi:hypothetical protein ABZP36_021204 [Zizania latifolia]
MAPPGCSHRGEREPEPSSRPRVASCLILAVTLCAVLAGFLSVSGVGMLVSSPSSSSSLAQRLSTGIASETAGIAVGTRMPSVERELDAARGAIRRAARQRSPHGGHSGCEGNNVSSANWRRFIGEVEYARLERVYRNPSAFYRSYVEMKRRFKVYVYEEGEPPIVHEGPCKNIYTVEGRFIEELELMVPPPRAAASAGVRTWDPARAHAFFLPFSVSQMVQLAYRPLSYDLAPLRSLVADYVRVVASRHPFWNRSAGADHFMLSCHDWGPHASRGHPELSANGIRALCNANTSEGFRPAKDVSVPEINLYDGDTTRELRAPAPAQASRPFLAFFAGGRHGHVRDLLLRHWKGRDPAAFPVYEYDLPTGAGTGDGNPYYSFMRRARFCLCPSGHEVASPRVVEAIQAECVPVVVADWYARPFADVLRWETFSVAVPVADIPRLREVLERIPTPEVERLRDGVRLVKRHFTLHQPPERLDMFHMILHSVWLRRLNLKLNH